MFAKPLGSRCHGTCWLWFHSISNGVTAGTKAVRRFPFRKWQVVRREQADFTKPLVADHRIMGKGNYGQCPTSGTLVVVLPKALERSVAVGCMATAKDWPRARFAYHRTVRIVCSVYSVAEPLQYTASVASTFRPKGLFFGIYKFKFYPKLNFSIFTCFCVIWKNEQKSFFRKISRNKNLKKTTTKFSKILNRETKQKNKTIEKNKERKRKESFFKKIHLYF